MSDNPKLKTALAELDKAVQSAASFVTTELDRNDIPTMLRAFKEIDEAKKYLAEIEKVLTATHKSMSEQMIPEAFENNGFDSVKTAGRNFIVATRLNATIPEDKRSAGFEWLRNVAHVPELIIQTVNSRQLSSFVSSYFEEHAVMPPEEAISVHQVKYTSMRKA